MQGLSHQAVLYNELMARKQANPSYSLRAFSRHLGISVATLSQVISGKRPLSLKSAELVCNRLTMSPVQRAEFLNSLITSRVSSRQSESRRANHVEPLDVETFKVIADWHHYAILGLAHLPRNRASTLWIAKRLGISQQAATAAFTRLLKLGLIERKDNGFRQCSKPLRVQPEVASPAVRKYHHQVLELAGKALAEEPIERREFGAMTMTMPSGRLPEAKALIRKFREDLSHLMEQEPGDQVYTLAMQFFPITKDSRTPRSTR